jgi:hypothetical protein
MVIAALAASFAFGQSETPIARLKTTGPMNAGGNVISNLAPGVASTDAATVGQVNTSNAVLQAAIAAEGVLRVAGDAANDADILLRPTYPGTTNIIDFIVASSGGVWRLDWQAYANAVSNALASSLTAEAALRASGDAAGTNYTDTVTAGMVTNFGSLGGLTFTNIGSSAWAAPGYLRWDDDEHGLVVDTDTTDSSITLGEEINVRVRNTCGTNILNGQIVKLCQGAGPFVNVTLADNSTLDGSIVFGVATTDIANNGFGRVTTFGKVRGLVTTGYAEGAIVYLGRNGAITNAAPLYPAYEVAIGVVEYTHGTEGRIFVKPYRNGWARSGDIPAESDTLQTVVTRGGTVTSGVVTIDAANARTNTYGGYLGIGPNRWQSSGGVASENGAWANYNGTASGLGSWANVSGIASGAASWANGGGTASGLGSWANVSGIASGIGSWANNSGIASGIGSLANGPSAVASNYFSFAWYDQFSHGTGTFNIGAPSLLWLQNTNLQTLLDGKLSTSGGTVTGSILTTVDQLTASPASDELVTAEWVRSLALQGQSWYWTAAVTNGFGEKTANFAALSLIPDGAVTTSIPSPVSSSTYLAGGIATQLFGSVRSPVTFEIWCARDGGNPNSIINAHPEIYYVFAGTTNHLGDWEAGDQNVGASESPTKYTWTVSFPEPTITGGVYIIGYLKSGTVSGLGAGLKIYGGGVYDSHMQISAVPAGESAADVAADLAAHEAQTIEGGAHGGLTAPIIAAAGGIVTNTAINLGANHLTVTTIKPVTDSSSAVRITKADGTNSVLNVDTTNGRVGIGTDAPLTRLHIKTVTTVSIDELGMPLYFEGTRSRFGYGETPTSVSKVAFGSGWGTSDDFAVHAKTSGDFSEATQRFTVKMSGNVGIGTTAPAAKLHVVGSAIISSNLTVNGLSYIKLPSTAQTNGLASGILYNDAGTIKVMP